jgi:hypothetical protein
VPIQAQWGQLAQRVKTALKVHRAKKAKPALKVHKEKKESQGLMAEAVLALLARKVLKANLGLKANKVSRV